MNNENNASARILSLRDIAAWQFPELSEDVNENKLTAGLPSLQRGAVWRPNQVELLWDSIMRGFPIGSLVVTPCIENQSTRGGKHGTQLKEYTHHLLDGQQRANAIALGYLDPFADQEPSGAKNILWLDLIPQGSPELQHKAVASFNASTRSFLLRNTTSAHPWGFKISDDPAPVRIESKQAREAKKKFLQFEDQKAHPSPVDGWPIEANAPIPLAWMLEVFQEQIKNKELSSLDDSFERKFWAALLTRYLLKDMSDKTEDSDNNYRLTPWRTRLSKLIDSWINSEKLPEQSSHLVRGMFRASNMKIVALEVSSEALTAAHRPIAKPENGETEGKDPIANVEHLFQRLNGGGTDLSAADRAYSMIKAYWPGVEHSIEAIKQRPPETQVALLGARLALDDAQKITNKENNLPPQPTVRSLRRLATDKAKTDEALEIKSMFGLLNDEKSSAPIQQAIKQLDEWFLYSKEKKNWGLPPVLRSRMATQAPEVFLFLLRLAHYKVSNNSPEPDEEVRRKLLGLATAVHWFSEKREPVVRELWTKSPEDYLYGNALKGSLGDFIDDANNESIARILTPAELEDYIDINSFAEEKLSSWRWWNTLMIEPAKKELETSATPEEVDAAILRRRNQYESFISILSHGWYNRTNALLLMYAQRDQMHHFFKDYSAQDADFWAAHNVPWDFDHMLQMNAYHGTRNNAFREVCREWGNTIANLHILPFELNRGRQDNPLDTIFDGKEHDEKVSFLHRMHVADNDLAHNKRSAFSMENADARNVEYVLNFTRGARARLISLYSDWFETLRIGELLEK